MRTMHYRALVLVAWLVFFYNVERVRWFVGAGQIQFVTRYAYIFVALSALITLALPILHRLPLWLLGSGGVVLFIVLKAWFGYPLWGVALPVTVTELCAILVTELLTRQVIGAIWEFEDSIVNFTIKRVGRQTKVFDIEQGEMYQEVRRARAFSRPLALMAIEPAADSFEVATERMVEEVQQATMKQYVLAALAKAIEDQLGPYSVIAQDGDKFLAMLPESSREDISRLTAQVRRQVQDSMGLEIRVGVATLPEEDTFDGLVEAAYVDMKDASRKFSEETSALRATSVQGQVTSQ
jgi:GGDEF domain-containing protein